MPQANLAYVRSYCEFDERSGVLLPGCGKAVRFNLCEAPSGPFRQIGPDRFSARDTWLPLLLDAGRNARVLTPDMRIRIVNPIDESRAGIAAESRKGVL